MGSTFENIHVRTDDADVVQKAIEAASGVAWVSAEAKNGWVSIYPYRLDLGAVARPLSLPVLGLSVYDSDIAQYELYERGELVDTFDSAPDYWVGEPDEDGEPTPPKSPEERARLSGKPECLLPHCLPGTTLEQVRSALGSTVREIHQSMSAHLNVPFDEAAFERDVTKKVEAIKAAFGDAWDFLAGDESGKFQGEETSILDHLSADLIISRLAELLGLEERMLYSGSGRVTWEEGFPLVFVGTSSLAKDEIDRFLEDSIPDCRVVPHTGKVIGEFADQKLALMKKLLERGANPNGREMFVGFGSFTPLMRAASLNSLEAARMLLEAGADPNASMPYSGTSGSVVFTPLLFAKQTQNSEDLIACLQRFGAVDLGGIIS